MLTYRWAGICSQEPASTQRTAARKDPNNAAKAAALPLLTRGDSLRRTAIANKAARSRRQSAVGGVQLGSAAVRVTLAVGSERDKPGGRRDRAPKTRLSPAQAAALLRRAAVLARWDQGHVHATPV